MAYTLVFVKDSIQLREARLSSEAKTLAGGEEKNPQVLEALNPSPDANFQDKNEPRVHKTRKEKKGCAALFDITNILDGIKAVIKPRPNNGRTLLILAMLIFILEYFLIVRMPCPLFISLSWILYWLAADLIYR